jgi:hypothetical protein
MSVPVGTAPSELPANRCSGVNVPSSVIEKSAPSKNCPVGLNAAAP